jgi:hypothetical protein
MGFYVKEYRGERNVINSNRPILFPFEAPIAIAKYFNMKVKGLPKFSKSFH